MNWQAIVPLKRVSERKARLSRVLTPAQREVLSRDMFRHVIDAMRGVPQISEIAVLSAEPPDNWRGRILADEGGGLNCALAHACSQLIGANVVVIHADLPFLSAHDIDALLDGAGCGCAIAPDRHELGTNALALRAMQYFPFSFGTDSLKAHRRARVGHCRLVRRKGLAFDIDTPDDLELARKVGFDFGVPAE